jgi:hypothetical protein
VGRGLTIASAISLLTFVVGLGFWAASHMSENVMIRSARGHLLVIESNGHLVRQMRDWFGDEPKGDPHSPREMWRMLETQGVAYHQWTPAVRTSVPGVTTYTSPHNDPAGPPYRVTGIPYAYLVLPAAILPGLWLVRRARRSARKSRGRCVSCGYDLRETPGRCPECGTAAATPAAA